MYVVSLANFQPTPRYDNLPWTQIQIQEGPTVEGPWTIIETKALVPDLMPDRPSAVDVTTENGTLAFGWYRVIFLDADGDTSTATQPVSAGAAAPFLPSVKEVALWLRARTKDSTGTEVGTFTTETRPTENDVQSIIGLVGNTMISCVGPWLPESLWQKSRFVVSLKAAMVIELSYFPEQLDEKMSNYEYLERWYERELATLCSLAEDYIPDNIPQYQGDLPLFYFGDGLYAIWDTVYRPVTETFVGLADRPVVQIFSS